MSPDLSASLFFGVSPGEPYHRDALEIDMKRDRLEHEWKRRYAQHIGESYPQRTIPETDLWFYPYSRWYGTIFESSIREVGWEPETIDLPEVSREKP